MADMLGYPCLFTVGAVVPAFADMPLGFDLMNVNVPMEDVHPAEAVVQAEGPGDAPAPEYALVTFGPDRYPRYFAYLRRGMIHDSPAPSFTMGCNMHYPLTLDKINKYEEVNDACRLLTLTHVPYVGLQAVDVPSCVGRNLVR